MALLPRGKIAIHVAWPDSSIVMAVGVNRIATTRLAYRSSLSDLLGGQRYEAHLL